MTAQKNVWSIFHNFLFCSALLTFLTFLLTDSNNFNPRIQKAVKEVFPEKNITAIDFRRCLPTLLWSKPIDSATKEELLENYARLVNTSVTVLEEHYIRGRATEKTKKVLNFLEQEILETPESKYNFSKIVLM
jgi:hypothetical protein